MKEAFPSYSCQHNKHFIYLSDTLTMGVVDSNNPGGQQKDNVDITQI